MGSAAAVPRIGRYEILSRIGAGGMAEVFRARAPGLGRAQRLVALKRMHPHLAHSPEFIELFFREAQVASTLDHPNLVAVHESGQFGDQYFLIMEYVDGISLRRLISNVYSGGGSFDVAVVIAIGVAICAGLHHAHERCGEDGRRLEIVHRDVSPGNVLVSYDGAVKLGDFGVAKATSDWTAMHSSTGTIRGKVAYMAPEQARGDVVDRRADIFAVGNVLFELLSGRRLIASRGEVEMLHDLVFGAYGEPTLDRRDCPAALLDVVRRALERVPVDRFDTALQMQQALEAVALEHGLFAPPSAVAAFVGRWSSRVTEDETDAPTSVRSPALVPAPTEPAPADAPTLTVDGVADELERPRRWWIAIPLVAATALAAGWIALPSRVTATPIETASPRLHAASFAPTTVRLRVQISSGRADTSRVEPEAGKRPRKTKRRASRRSSTPSPRKPPRGESLFPG